MKRLSVALAATIALSFPFILLLPARTASSSSQASYLVSFKTSASLATLASAGIGIQRSWPNLHTAEVRAGPASLARLRSNPAVVSVEPDRTFRATSLALATPSSTEVSWALRSLTVPAAWKEGSTGTGIKVCDLDSGIDYTHPKFKNGVIKGSKNFVIDGHANAADGNGHGTYTAGEIAAGVAGGDVVGAAYGVQLYVARVLDDSGTGTTSALIAGVNWCVNTVHAKILNMSFGSSQSSRAEQRLFTKIYKEGVLTFAASGNDGQSGISYPAGYSSVIAVGAVDATKAVAPFSNFGPKLELVAPGVNVLSTVLVGSGRKVSTTDNGTTYATIPLQYASIGTVSGPLIDCGLASSDTSCANVPASGNWIALVDRGTITFGEKVQNVMAQGASAVIIANNDASNPDDAGVFTLGSDGTWIPAVSVSYSGGAALRSAGLGTASIGLTPWDYAYADGTSASSPYAAAVAALAWSANPKLTNTQIRTILDTTAKHLGAPGRDQYYGYGLVQAKGAVARARATHA